MVLVHFTNEPDFQSRLETVLDEAEKKDSYDAPNSKRKTKLDSFRERCESRGLDGSEIVDALKRIAWIDYVLSETSPVVTSAERYVFTPMLKTGGRKVIEIPPIYITAWKQFDELVREIKIRETIGITKEQLLPRQERPLSASQMQSTLDLFLTHLDQFYECIHQATNDKERKALTEQYAALCEIYTNGINLQAEGSDHLETPLALLNFVRNNYIRLNTHGLLSGDSHYELNYFLHEAYLDAISLLRDEKIETVQMMIRQLAEIDENLAKNGSSLHQKIKKLKMSQKNTLSLESEKWDLTWEIIEQYATEIQPHQKEQEKIKLTLPIYLAEIEGLGKFQSTYLEKLKEREYRFEL